MEHCTRAELDCAANFLRDSDSAYQRAKAEYEGIREVRYYDMKPSMIDTSQLSYVLAKTGRYIDSIDRGGGRYLSQDTFFLEYDLQSNLLGKAVHGQIDILELSFRVDWSVREVVARLYTGQPRKVHIPNELRKVLEEGKVGDLMQFVDMTGLFSRHVTRAEAQRLIPVFQNGAYVQCKLTRLVKGCLIYLDHLESGTKTYASANLQTLNYKAKELLTAMSFRNTAYVYVTHEEDSAYNLILYAMCQQYPSPLFGGVEHVKIPADGDDIYLVGYSPRKRYHNVVVSPQHVMGALMVYADTFWLEEELESAMIIACSLRQNRYLDVVGLPAVVSECDLIYPALSGRTAGGVREKTILSKEAAVMLGRFHQMACFVLFKDLDTSLRSTVDRDSTLRSLLHTDGSRLIAYMEDQMDSGILQMSNGMIWLKYLDNETIARLRKHSVFEGFWLVKRNPVNVLKDGMIKCLKQGVKNQLNVDKLDSFEILKEEVILGGGDSEQKISDGAFNVSLTLIRNIEDEEMKILSFSEEETVSFNF